jgi:hypothetical protein
VLAVTQGPIAMHWLSGDGHILWCNERELEILQYTAEGQSKTVLVTNDLHTVHTARDVNTCQRLFLDVCDQ